MAAAPKKSAEIQAISLLETLTAAAPKNLDEFEQIKSLEPSKAIFSSEQSIRIAFIKQVAKILGDLDESDFSVCRPWSFSPKPRFPLAGVFVVKELLRRSLPFEESDFQFVLSSLGKQVKLEVYQIPFLPQLVRHLGAFLSNKSPSPQLSDAIKRCRNALSWVQNAPERNIAMQLNDLIAASGKKTPLKPGEAWSDAALAHVRALDKNRTPWIALLAHCATAKSSAPSDKWLRIAHELRDTIGASQFFEHMESWFPLVDKPRTAVIAEWHPGNPDPNQLLEPPNDWVLKGLVWCTAGQQSAGLARALANLAVSCYRKIPLKGPREVGVANACVWSLGRMPGIDAVGQLAFLKARVKFGTAGKMIEKSLAAAAERMGITPSEIEELGVPTYGLTDVGLKTEPIGDFVARLTVDPRGDARLRWFRKDEKELKAPPAVVKTADPGRLKELKQTEKDLQRMLSAQRDRLDQLFLAKRSWSFAEWKLRYLDHPLVGTLARRLIWEIHDGREKKNVIFHDKSLVDVHGKPLDFVKDDVRVELWHPIARPVADVLVWRTWLETREVQQPFKQAHREVYLLAPAEEQTGVYSNRFAAHIIRQHQFHSLCAIRNWKNKLRLMVDSTYPPTSLYVEPWKIRAEFWVEGIGTEYGADTNDAGAYKLLASDQVRFYPLEAAQREAHAFGGGYGYREGADTPLPLNSVPPLVFSEVMRDVDLFVGVSSIGGDPAWIDGRAEGTHHNYFREYSFGDLRESGQGRKDLLMRMIPRLKIASRCSFSDRFLVVKGDLRTYKIHLGSGNILMEPNDQYLCIVPARSVETKLGSEKLFLPFDGDRTLSIIISKALLLAADAQITDATIMRQLRA